MPQIIPRIFLGIIVVLALCTVREISLYPDGKTHLYFFDVGQGDSAFILTPQGKQILIDGGPSWKTLEELGKVMPFFDRSIDLVVLSHFDLDHSTSIAEVLKRYDVKRLLVSELNEGSRGIAGHILSLAQHIPTTISSASDKILLEDNFSLHVLWPPKNLTASFAEKRNNQSLVFRLQSGKHSALFTGDIEKKVEDVLTHASQELQSDILKIPHHGSKTSSSTGFLLRVMPQTSIISLGIDNHFGHPHSAVIKRLRAINTSILRTDVHGTIEVIWEPNKKNVESIHFRP